MIKYILKRAMWMIPVMLGVITIVFTITYFSPGDPVMLILGSNNYTPEAYAAKSAQLGLDKGYWEQLGTYVWNLVTTLDMGISYLTSVPVAQELSERIPVTMRLTLLGISLMMAIGLPSGILSALKQYSAMDMGLTSFSLILAAMPSFVLALLSALYFGLTLRWFPITGLATWKHFILPVFCSAGGGIAVYTRMTRTTMLEVIRQDYIRTARAKGLKENVVVRRHALKNCLIPLTTVVGAFIATVFSGSIIVETIFNIRGMGLYLVAGITGRDYPIINGTVFVISLLVCTVNLCVDIAYSFIDPRIKAQFITPRKKEKIVSELVQTQEEVEG
jgi:peptide/nickel transport system permease protein